VKKITKTGEQIAIELAPFEDEIDASDHCTESVHPDEVQFHPTKRQKQARALLAIKARDKGIALSSINAYTAVELTGIDLFKQWFTNEFFVEWVHREGDYAKRVDYLLSRHLDNLEEVIEDSTGELDLRTKMAAGEQLLKIRKSIADDEGAASTDNKADLAKRIAAAVMDKRKIEAKKQDSKPRPAELKLPRGCIDVD
jgi:hypothetical protein